MYNPAVLDWVLIGAFAGWAASRLMKFQLRVRMITEMLICTAVGVLGAVLGGTLLWLFGANITRFGLLNNVLVAIIGACMLLWALRKILELRAHPGSPTRH
ncbi:GlsB/YeaQ/YmgE family stress response membrane protein [Tomitella biformata]|uniref:GlsB/YeaQ/YmgE family stress response membrane protein n=1 Tax=Tomitella biformata TaxID=630403 RepID=UPI0004666DAE|nr:GlsB/YeaQ/YmgE family stress response membrane protein [Tomitella biformata]